MFSKPLRRLYAGAIMLAVPWVSIAATDNGYWVPEGSELVNSYMADPTIIETNYGGQTTYFLSGTTYWDHLHVRYSHDGVNFQEFATVPLSQWGNRYCGIWAPNFSEFGSDWVRVTFAAERQLGRSTCLSRSPAEHDKRVGIYEAWFSVRNGTISEPYPIDFSAWNAGDTHGPMTREYPFIAYSNDDAKNTLRIDPFDYYDWISNRRYVFFAGYFGHIRGSTRNNSIVRFSPDSSELVELTQHQKWGAGKIVEAPAVARYKDTKGTWRTLFAFSAGSPLWTDYRMYYSDRTPTGSVEDTQPLGTGDWKDLIPPIKNRYGGYCWDAANNEFLGFSGGGGEFLNIGDDLWVYYHINHNLTASNGHCETHTRHVYRHKVRIDWYTDKPVSILLPWTRFEWFDFGAPHYWNRQYSLDVRDGGKTVAPCVWGSLLGTQMDTEFTGSCANGQQLNWGWYPEARVCTTDNGDWGQARCTPH